MGVATLGEDLQAMLPQELKPNFVGDLPSLSSEGIGIILLDGADSTEHFIEGSFFFQIVRVVIRTKQYPRGRDWCQRLIDLWHRHTGGSILQMFLVGGIMYLGRNEEKLYEFQLTFRITYQEV